VLREKQCKGTAKFQSYQIFLRIFQGANARNFYSVYPNLIFTLFFSTKQWFGSVAGERNKVEIRFLTRHSH
jgi:hypothetical protein